MGILEEGKLCSMEIQKRSHSKWGVREDFLKDKKAEHDWGFTKSDEKEKDFPSGETSQHRYIYNFSKLMG